MKCTRGLLGGDEGACDPRFAVSLLCGFDRRRCVVLGKQHLQPGDAVSEIVFEGAVVFCGGERMYCAADFVFVLCRLATAPRPIEIRLFRFCL